MDNSIKPTVLRGRVWVLRDKDGKPIDDIDTDQIYHNRYLTITDIEEMGKYALGNLEGWEDFPSKAKPGDILVVGKNFGAGSSRQQAVDCFRALGIQAIVGESFGAIYKRNAINSGFPIIEFPGIMGADAEGNFLVENGDELEIDLASGRVVNLTKRKDIGRSKPFSRVQMDIYQAGSLFALGLGN